jgi:tRNA uridine 5-carboxymethylaminomethyl modification enzyme
MLEELQEAMLCTVPGLESVKIVWPVYRVEYNFVDARELAHTFSCHFISPWSEPFSCSNPWDKVYQGAWSVQILKELTLNPVPRISSSQVRGSCHSGCHHRHQCRAHLLIFFIISPHLCWWLHWCDDWWPHNTCVEEPYYMFTSQSEYCMTMWGNNANLHLMEKGHAVGIVFNKHWTLFNQECDEFVHAEALLHKTVLSPCAAEHLTSCVQAWFWPQHCQ